MSQEWIDSNNWGGMPSRNQRREQAKVAQEKASTSATKAVGDEIKNLKRSVRGLEQRLDRIETIMYRSLLIQEKQLLALNTSASDQNKLLELTSDEIKARHVMQFSIFDVLTEQGLKDRYRLLAKKCHPDVKGVESDTEFLILESSYKLLLDSISH